MRLFKILLLFIVYLCLNLSVALAADDSFGPAEKIETQHFAVYCSPQVERLSLLQKLDIGPAYIVISDGANLAEDDLALALEALYNFVMQNLDMYLYSLEGNIKICKDRDHLNKVYESIFGSELDSSSFYVYDYNTIYISADDFTKEILGHEIAHMIISNYFVVQPPTKVAEILSGYVEYQLRKPARGR